MKISQRMIDVFVVLVIVTIVGLTAAAGIKHRRELAAEAGSHPVAAAYVATPEDEQFFASRVKALGCQNMDVDHLQKGGCPHLFDGLTEHQKTAMEAVENYIGHRFGYQLITVAEEIQKYESERKS